MLNLMDNADTLDPNSSKTWIRDQGRPIIARVNILCTTRPAHPIKLFDVNLMDVVHTLD